jgi:hypothetical protein
MSSGRGMLGIREPAARGSARVESPGMDEVVEAKPGRLTLRDLVRVPLTIASQWPVGLGATSGGGTGYAGLGQAGGLGGGCAGGGGSTRAPPVDRGPSAGGSVPGASMLARISAAATCLQLNPTGQEHSPSISSPCGVSDQRLSCW